jgi:hypothetical protein
VGRPESFDPLMEALRESRPDCPPSVTSAKSPNAVALMEDIMSTSRSAVSQGDASSSLPISIPWRRSVALGAVVALVLLAAQVANREPATDAPVGKNQILTIASRSQAAMSGSGKAVIVFKEEGGGITDSQSVATLIFNGDDVETVIDFAGQPGRPGFQAHNKIVDGQFYLRDGPPGQQRWIRDTNAPDMRASDVLSFDPRTLLPALNPQVRFKQIPDSNSGIRHFRATSPAGLSAVNLSAGPVDPNTIKSMDVWVGSDDVVTRIELVTERTEAHRPGARTVIVDDNGQKKKIIDPADTTPEVTKTIRSTYSITFSDVGQEFEVTAPDDVTDVAGQG